MLKRAIFPLLFTGIFIQYASSYSGKIDIILRSRTSKITRQSSRKGRRSRTSTDSDVPWDDYSQIGRFRKRQENGLYIRDVYTEMRFRIRHPVVVAGVRG